MFPTLQCGDIVVFQKKFFIKFLKRNQIVLIRNSQFTGRNIYIKRIVGLEGDEINLSLLSISVDTLIPKKNLLINEGYCFVLGDSDGIDSRYWGPLPIKSIIGLVLFSINSLSYDKKI
jgi:signal peptidase I